jgi:hypothetical protein
MSRLDRLYDCSEATNEILSKGANAVGFIWQCDDEEKVSGESAEALSRKEFSTCI